MIHAACVAVAGQPNTGKSTIFSVLTGLHQEVGNWPGKTVEKKQGKAPQNQGGYTVIDLPGSYSLHAGSAEEDIAVDFLLNAAPDLTVVVASAVSPERTLSYALDIIALERPVIIALNMADIAEQNGVFLDADKIRDTLGVPVLTLSAIKKDDGAALRQTVMDALRSPVPAAPVPQAAIAALPGALREAYSLAVETLCGNDGMERRQAEALVWRALNGDKDARSALARFAQSVPAVGLLLTEESGMAFRKARYRWLEGVTDRDGRRALARNSATAAWDKWLLHPVWGGIMMCLILLLTLAAGFGVGFPLAALTGHLFSLPEEFILDAFGPGMPALNAMAVGVWRGVGAVITMLPFIVVFYSVFAFLEDVGYMARAAFLMDRCMSAIGLNGKAFIPLLFAVPCNITGVVGSRTVNDPKERMLTILLIPLVPCTAKIVVMVSIASWLFPASTAALVVLALLGMNALVLGAISLLAGRFILDRPRLEGLLMELPHFHKPNPRSIMRYVTRNVRGFLRKASTLIVSFSVVLWFLSYYPTATIETSLLGRLGAVLEPVGRLMGADWRLLTSLLASGVSKEAVLATIGVLFNATTDQLPAILRANVSNASALAFMSAQSLFIPCVATLGILYSESRSKKLFAAIVAYTLVLPVAVASLVYRVALLWE